LLLTVRVRGSSLGATVFNYYESESGADALADDRKQLLQLLAAPFQAAANAYVAFRRNRDTLISFGELAHVSLALFDMGGRPVHQSRRLDQLLALDPEPARIRAETARLAANLSACVSSRNPLAHLDRPIKSRLTTKRGSYALSAISLGDGFGFGTLVGVMIEDLSPPRFDPQRLAAEYHLTKRELQIAALVERRMSAREIAGTLGISVNTARRHTEHVLAKLGVHSKKAAVERMTAATGTPDDHS
jgi:DNA-binding CsgD family transcriptional regulator